FQPHFTYHGFRYVELSSEGGTVELLDCVGMVANTALLETSRFHCSDAMVNQLRENILWGQRGNFFSVPTDCPQRNERMGWTGDAQVFCKTANYNMQAKSFFKKYLRDIRDAQLKDGAITDVAPIVSKMGAGHAAWGDAITIIPYITYLFSKDKSILTENYKAMKKWVAYCKSESIDYIRPSAGYGDWLSIHGLTPKDLMQTAFFAYSVLLTCKVAAILEKFEDVKLYSQEFDAIRKSYNDAFVSQDCRMPEDTQAGYVLSIAFDLVSEECKEKMAGYLVDDIRKNGNHLTTGFIGISYLLPVLTDMGYADIAYTLLLNRTYPSWGYSIENGATTIWERWNSYTKESGFGDVSMNSFNHYSLGSVGEWMMGYMGGIRVTEENAGFESVLLQPVPDPMGRITECEVSYDSIKGEITSRWQLRDGLAYFIFQIPDGVCGKAVLPDGSIYKITSGEHRFTCPLKLS
ncbi:MAG: alpha-L-rhamnosidase C-terminal domain-containing protein, partial [Eubacteriales bacterium]|nr:alpha-L-rhamnosidase C-terminal domain-containing protein [Eubacteriales bacterium]